VPRAIAPVAVVLILGERLAIAAAVVVGAAVDGHALAVAVRRRRLVPNRLLLAAAPAAIHEAPGNLVFDGLQLAHGPGLSGAQIVGGRVATALHRDDLRVDGQQLAPAQPS
jgi:hypothetical protein